MGIEKCSNSINIAPRNTISSTEPKNHSKLHIKQTKRPQFYWIENFVNLLICWEQFPPNVLQPIISFPQCMFTIKLFTRSYTREFMAIQHTVHLTTKHFHFNIYFQRKLLSSHMRQRHYNTHKKRPLQNIANFENLVQSTSLLSVSFQNAIWGHLDF